MLTNKLTTAKRYSSKDIANVFSEDWPPVPQSTLPLPSVSEYEQNPPAQQPSLPDVTFVQMNPLTSTIRQCKVAITAMEEAINEMIDYSQSEHAEQLNSMLAELGGMKGYTEGCISRMKDSIGAISEYMENCNRGVSKIS